MSESSDIFAPIDEWGDERTKNTMNICRITKITPDGKPWGEPPNGPYYPFYIVFADGAAGQANAKSNPPAYKVGDEVGYEITGATPRGVPKLKIDRKADPAFCQNTTPKDHHPDLEAAPKSGSGYSPTGAGSQPPQRPVSPAAHTQTPPTQGEARLSEYSGIYVACIGAARKTCNEASFDSDAETVRQIATAFFIQALREGLKVEGNVPF